MTRRRSVRAALAVAVGAFVAAAFVAVAGGCGAPEGPAAEADSTFVQALAELHLADARAALDTTRRAPAFAESLRAQALAAHGLDSAALAARMDALAADPDLARATYDALDARLSLERQGVALGP